MRLSVGDQHSRFLSILTRFGGYYHCFGVPKRFPWLLNPKVLLRVGHQQSRFWPIMARFMDYYSLFWGPGVISTVDEHRGASTCRLSTLAVLADYGRFMDYYSLISGPSAISLVNKPRGAFMYRSSKVLGLSVSGLFYGLLLTVLGSQSDFHGCRAPRCAYVLVVKTRNLGQFWPVSWTITPYFGVPE